MAGVIEQGAQRGRLAALGHVVDRMADMFYRLDTGVYLHMRGGAQMAGSYPAHPLRHGSGEQRRLPLGGCAGDDPLDIGGKAPV